MNIVRVATGYPEVHVGNPKANAEEILNLIKKMGDADVYLFPELCITGYTCGDLFNQSVLLDSTCKALRKIAEETKNISFLVVGAPWERDNALYNCAFVFSYGKIVGIVPKTYLPNYKEFYEARWFKSGVTTNHNFNSTINFGDFPPAFATDQLFELILDKKTGKSISVGIEICEDVWSTIPPSSYQALAGATLLLNLSASNETVGKADYRRNMIAQQSGRCIASYVYCSCGPTESTSELVFGGHCIIAENGNIIKETKRFQDEDFIVADIEIEKFQNERRRTPTFNHNQEYIGKKNFINIQIPFSENRKPRSMSYVDPHPFIPKDQNLLNERCKEIFNIQVSGLKRRLNSIHKNTPISIGISGGLDSTLAALVLAQTCSEANIDRKSVDAITMPGFGTSQKTNLNAKEFIKQLGFNMTEIDIRPMCLQAFRDMKHLPFSKEKADENCEHLLNVESLEKYLVCLPENSKDVVFENIQARIRTFILMSRGFVIGTGDLSEIALGWCTYNGDQMSMYNVNCSIPKTLVKWLCQYVSNDESILYKIIDSKNEETATKLKNVLNSIISTPVSPELLPLGKNGEITQSTEEIIGPYVLHDFFLYYFCKTNYSPRDILELATTAYLSVYDKEQIKQCLIIFLRRFFGNQFKRQASPDGPKVGSISLSPRGDWRMPSDVDVECWIEDLSKN